MAFIGALLLVLAGLIAWRASKHPRTPVEPQGRSPASAAASISPPTESVPETPSPPVASNVMPDGKQVPELPADAPKSVSFGVVLLNYRGAEGAPADARPKDAALSRAKELIETAQHDFADAVKKGDRGSTAEAGTMPRGVLEPSLEYILFTLKKGEVYVQPIDTPRGYWLLRRTQ
jgi:PPIC-type PPIASE domain